MPVECDVNDVDIGTTLQTDKSCYHIALQNDIKSDTKNICHCRGVHINN